LEKWKPKFYDPLAVPGRRVEIATPADALPWLNFILFVPTALPSGTELLQGTVRREVPPGQITDRGARPPEWTEANPSSYRMEIGNDSRHFRVKQFLYDWAPPAADQPCLWRSKTSAHTVDTNFVVWLGTDFMGHQAGTARLRRTNIELSVTRGAFSAEELVSYYRGLEPVDDRQRRGIAECPFAELSYWSRYSAAVADVPYGLFRFHRENPTEKYSWSTDQHHLQRTGFPTPSFSAAREFAFDSVGIYEGERGREAEIILTAPPDRGREIRLIMQHDGGGRVDYPPYLTPHPCELTSLFRDGQEAYTTYVSEEFGPFHAVFNSPRESLRIYLMTSAAVGHSLAWFSKILASLAFA
jgi:hypothetical protein